jgi:hypothetical protein
MMMPVMVVMPMTSFAIWPSPVVRFVLAVAVTLPGVIRWRGGIGRRGLGERAAGEARQRHAQHPASHIRVHKIRLTEALMNRSKARNNASFRLRCTQKP